MNEEEAEENTSYTNQQWRSYGGGGGVPQSNGPKKEGRVRGEIKEKEKEREIIQGDRLLFKAYTIR